MIKVALISPKGNIFSKNERLMTFLKESKYMESFRALWTGPNLGLITIAAYFPDGWEISYIDENYVNIDYSKQYDIVFISAMTQQAIDAYSIASKFRKKGILTVIGGIHATIYPNEVAEYVDVVMQGEGERLVTNFVKDYLAGNIKNIYKDNSLSAYKFENALMPRYDLLKEYDYPLITLQTTRGCPHNCSFCAASKVFGKAYRRKDNDQILLELKEISSQYPGKLILFADDNVFVKNKESKELLERVEELDIRWLAQTDISIAKDDELLELMVKAGCQWIVIGFESVSDKSLYNLDQHNWKLGQSSKYKEHINKIQSYGIGIYGTFIVGLDHDTSNIFSETVNFIDENKLYGANITVPTPLPGTDLRHELQQQDRIINKDWSYYTLWDVTTVPMNFTIEELEDGLLWVYKELSKQHTAQKRLAYMRQLTKRRRVVIKASKGDIS